MGVPESPAASDKIDASVNVLEAGSTNSNLGPVPERKFSPMRTLKSLGSKDAWLGDYDYGSLFIPNMPWSKTKRELPFYGVHDKLPYLLMIILGLQHALAMVGGLVVPPLLLGGAAGANLGPEIQQYLISGSLIWCAIGTVVQVSRVRIFGTKYYLGTGIISVKRRIRPLQAWLSGGQPSGEGNVFYVFAVTCALAALWIKRAYASFEAIAE